MALKNGRNLGIGLLSAREATLAKWTGEVAVTDDIAWAAWVGSVATLVSVRFWVIGGDGRHCEFSLGVSRFVKQIFGGER